MRVTRNAIVEVFEAVALWGAKKATKYLSPRETVKATYQGKRDRRLGTHTILVTFGRPNYHERQRIRTLRRAGEPFPVKKLELKSRASIRGK
jgi:hypothetical protein